MHIAILINIYTWKLTANNFRESFENGRAEHSVQLRHSVRHQYPRVRCYSNARLVLRNSKSYAQLVVTSFERATNRYAPNKRTSRNLGAILFKKRVTSFCKTTVTTFFTCGLFSWCHKSDNLYKNLRWISELLYYA